VIEFAKENNLSTNVVYCIKSRSNRI